MTNRGLLAAAAVLLVANAAILGGAMRNRAGNPDAVVRLSERELQSWGNQSEGAEEFVNLRLSWQMAPGPDGKTWFNRARLEALGARDLPAADDTTRTRGWMEPTRPGFVVLELAGPAWERWTAADQAARDAAAAKAKPDSDDSAPMHQPSDHVITNSRLMAIDFGLDAPALRDRYPERSQYLILPATYRADITPAVRDSAGRVTAPARVDGIIDRLLPGTVHVPRPLRDSLLTLGVARRDSTTHFDVTLKVGKKWEVWVE